MKPTLPVRFSIFICLITVCACQGASDPHSGWRDYGGAPDSAQYSSLKQINRENVKALKVAWRYATGDTNQYAFNPVVVDDVMYVLAKNNSIVALDAATGKEVWVHPTSARKDLITNRGINYWQSEDGSDRRLFFAANNFLEAVDARTGKSIAGFGTNGRVDLREGLGRDPSKLTLVQSTTPGRVFEDLLILGSATNQGYGSGPGDVRAYNVRTGRLVWTFHTVPHPGEFGYNTWPKDAWKSVGGANSWSELTLDVPRGIVYVPTASPKYNFYGADRKGANLFGDCLLALDARTGKRLWHFQMVHHDIWDYDNATAPQLLTVRHGGKMVDIVAQPGKEGFLWVFNRVTGKPLWPVEERPVPTSEMPGEQTWATQPFPLKPAPFSRQSFTVKDINPFIEDATERAELKKTLETARNHGLFTPPSREGTIEMPGNNGGSNWGGAAVDPTSGMLYVVSKDLPCLLKLEPDPAFKASSKSETARYVSGFGFMLTKAGLPAISPPWTSLTAYDLNQGTIKWQIPLGDVPALAAKGIKNTGTIYPKTGPVVTAGGLIFTGTRDGVVRALDQDTGKVLWQSETGTAIEGIPAVYEINGREYLVVCAAAAPQRPSPPGFKVHGEYIAFALGR